MAYVAHHTDFQSNIEPYHPAATALEQPRRGRLRRLFDAVMLGRQQRVQRDIDRYVTQRGVGLTDSLERDIASRMFTGDWNMRR